ncbi:hypothetical protein BZARG_1369 [Bizionia argentinensis JUB59]|uniref:Uncharacterized protein n=1 Tax=Bizionia argentinensis JUB59 TaxID=1046627 RepID=G2EDL8_9FLAO|nr:hypothetical protein [Bizionia argentinensis]EGV43504.1 hypothetical protein BZARG_1369 [Bizionia argentinensis JUB59]
MKKFILNVIAIVCFTFMSFANTNDIIKPLNLEPNVAETVNKTVDEDKLLWCVAYYSETVYSFMDKTYHTIVYVACTEVSL